MKQYLNKIRNAGFFLLVISFAISTLWGRDHAFFPMVFTVILLGIVVIYKALHWKENDKMSNYISVAFLVLVGLSFLGL